MTVNKHLSSAQLLLLTCLHSPSTVATLDTKQWNLLIRMSKQCNLTAHLAWLIEQQALEMQLPAKVAAHFAAAKTMVSYRQRLALWEINRLKRALAPSNLNFIVLKGGAYLLAGLPFAQARHFADIDILVAKDTIELVEQRLLNQDWQTQNTDTYDQHYYRQWMHEIPPLRHILRAIEVDIHHTIIPPVSKLKIDPEFLIEAAIEVANAKYQVLAPCDMILHSAVHLFFDSDLNNRLKDLVDLDQLIRHFSTDTTFLNTLVLRAEILGLLRPLYYTLHFTQLLLATPVPQAIVQVMHTKTAPPLAIRLLMDTLVPIAIMPEQPDQPLRKVALARWLLYIRSHYLRMPLTLLLPHLARKSALRWQHYFSNSEPV